MAEQEVDALLERMTKIATAVNAFKSETVQQAALAALVTAFEQGTVHRPKSTANAAPPEGAERGVDVDTASTTSKRRRPAKTSSASGANEKVQAVRDLDLRPKGVQSFDDFAAEKKPRDNQERFVLAIYWLEQVAKVSPITLGHVSATFKQTSGWREPGNVRVGVRMTAHRKNWLETSDMTNLRTTSHGRNFVGHDMPVLSKKK